ncbi:cystathionine gamma-lyase [Planoprotostelium fungivorum]|uniref:cystathionine gamma-lyase n=1 Tax=Planoprotostelium fungivorum TaxID=1890364 RepID=A0A2P6NX28_9EUKA|nr:cystathionine gamma-lyase [Planoprotostelium fungivorum]
MAHSSRFATDCIHAGQRSDPITGAVMTPISLATTFQQDSPGIHKGYEYSRTGNPTRTAYENCIAALEKAKYGLAFASGSSVTASIISGLTSGDHVISVDDVYGGTQRYFRRVASPNANIQFSFVDFNDEQAFRAAFQPQTKLVWLETPTNPTLKVVDIRKTAEIAHAHGAILVVDNTFLSPYFQQPLLLGADIVVHSVTKYINGHSDVVGGVLATDSEDWYLRMKFAQNSLGAVPSPFDCFMVMRGIKTLHLRMQQHEKSAFAVARLLEASDKVEKVAYPGLPSHPNHEIAKSQQKGFGGMVTFWLKGGEQQSRQFLEALKLFALAESLGGVESLAEHPAIMTHASVPAEQRAKLGISDNLCRLSIGVEDVEDILDDLKRALDAQKSTSSLQKECDDLQSTTKLDDAITAENQHMGGQLKSI